MVKSSFGILCGLLIFFQAGAEGKWHQGVVILKTDKVLTGEVNYNGQLSIIRLKDGDRIKSFSAFQVAAFNFHDEELGLVRKFISIPFKLSDSRFSDTFFEQIIKGEVSLLRKKKSFHNETPHTEDQVYSVNGYTINNFQYQHAMSFDYYFEKDGHVVHSDRFKRMLLPVLISPDSELSRFIDEKRLNVHKVYDQILIVKHYNELRKNEPEIFTSSF